MSAFAAILLWFAIVACGLIAGLYFAFSTFIMRALGSIDRSAGVAAMNAINQVIGRSLFLPLFFGSSIASLLLAAIGLFNRDIAGSGAMLAGGLIYFFGQFVVTMTCNVPLNIALTKTDPADAAAAAGWTNYLIRWTRWTHVRAVASTAALILFVVALGEL